MRSVISFAFGVVVSGCSPSDLANRSACARHFHTVPPASKARTSVPIIFYRERSASIEGADA